jgi:hypothetical protein
VSFGRTWTSYTGKGLNQDGGRRRGAESPAEHAEDPSAFRAGDLAVE